MKCSLFVIMTMLTWVLCITGPKYCKDDKPGRLYLCVPEQNEQSELATDQFHMSKLHKLIKDNQQIIQREISAKLGILQQRYSYSIDVLQ